MEVQDRYKQRFNTSFMYIQTILVVKLKNNVIKGQHLVTENRNQDSWFELHANALLPRAMIIR